MKIAILGTRGIPNNYGGFEQNAENLSRKWVEMGHKVSVYVPIEHPFKGDTWYGVKLIRIFSREDKLGIWGTFIYDFLCLLDATRKDYDIVLELGYSPNSLFYFLKPLLSGKLITFMDGLEWKRAKWNGLLKLVLKVSELLAVKFSDLVVADNEGIKKYYEKKFGISPPTFPHGADIFSNPDRQYLRSYNLRKFSYYMLVARFEPENNLDMILEGYLKSGSKNPFIVVGNPGTRHGKYLLKKYGKVENIRFVGAIYDQNKLSSLRWFSKIYFHGHSVGGTNPSLLEAMASGAFIAAHDNPFNRNVVGEDAVYFKNSDDVAEIIKNEDNLLKKKEQFIENNRRKIREIYNWDKIARRYIELFEELLKNK